MDRNQLIENTKYMLESHDDEIINLALNILFPTEINFILKFNIIKKDWCYITNKTYVQVDLTVLDFETEIILYTFLYNDYSTYYEECEQQCLNLLFIKIFTYVNYNYRYNHNYPIDQKSYKNLIKNSVGTKTAIDVINEIYTNHIQIFQDININISVNILINKKFEVKLSNIIFL